MKCCVIIPCFNHGPTIAAVARAALAHCPVLVVDDGSSNPLPVLPGCEVLRLPRNGGKGAALRAGFQQAAAGGFTHALTMDADGQHFAGDLPGFLAVVESQPETLVVGVRNFSAAGCPRHRRCSNAISTFWFRMAAGIRLRETQCGFRAYPLALTRRLQARSDRYAFELEFLVRTVWVGVRVVPVPVQCTYAPGQVGASHFRPVVDFIRIARLLSRLVLQSWFVPQALRADWSVGKTTTWHSACREFFTEHTQDRGRLALAVGLGLFLGIAPIWGFQMLAVAGLAHVLRLNKPVALLASNISIPPMMPFILYGGLALGHWLFTGRALDWSAPQATRARMLDYAGEWWVGSVVLAAGVALAGMLATYVLARLLTRKK
jgi:hypothetical protein